MIEKNEKIIEKLTKFSSYLIQVNSIYNDNSFCCLKDVATVSSGKSIKKIENGKYEIIGANGTLGYTNDYNIEDRVIITGRVGTIGTFTQYSNKIWCSDNTLIIKSKYFNYLYYFLKENFNAKLFNRGSTQPLITQLDMLKYEVKIPKNIDDLEKKLNSNYQVIESKNKENILLKKEKDLLLKKYFG